MDVIAEIKKLNFPPDQYVVFGGASLAARRIRETHDADILVVPELLERCRGDRQWRVHPRINANEPDGLDNGVIEIYPTIGGGYKADFNTLRKNAEIIGGVPFCDLKDVKAIKASYGREKDLRDIQLIDEFLKTQS